MQTIAPDQAQAQATIDRLERSLDRQKRRVACLEAGQPERQRRLLARIADVRRVGIACPQVWKQLLWDGAFWAAVGEVLEESGKESHVHDLPTG